MKAKEHDKAFALFLEGMSLRKIAKKICVSRSTVERWSSSERWVLQREIEYQKAHALIKKQYCQNYADKALLVSGQLYDTFQTVYADFKAHQHGVIKKRKFRHSQTQIFKMALMSLQAGLIEQELSFYSQYLDKSRE
ncbi:MAG: helix-turn-helix domain-containing protein [Bdellovibrionaceae bacterium]|nr:helix-turn-helix domain-containing protein [Pseudobdellovibrionaceae bacterium]